MDKETIDYSLSMVSFKDIPFSKYGNDFTFIVNKKRFQTNRVVADILSPIVRNFHYIDESIDEFSFNINENTELFSELLLLPSLNNTKLNSMQREAFAKYFLKLGNYVEYFILRFDSQDSIEQDNIFQQIQILSAHSSLISPEVYNELISIFSEHFDDSTNLDDFKLLNIDIIEDIISNKSLQLRDEDILLNFILDLYENDHQFSRLFKYVIFSNVNKEPLERFFEMFSIDDIDNEIWQNIFSLILNEKTFPKKHFSHKKKNDKDYAKVVFIGETNCGKTSIINRYLSNEMSVDILPTIAPSIFDHNEEVSDTVVKLSMYDLPGQEKYRLMVSAYMKNVDFIVFVYNSSDLASFEKKDEWIQWATQYSTPRIFIVCNKIDMITELPNNLIEEGRRYAEDHNYHFFETSSITGQNINELFNQIAQNLIFY